jgi:hypothetical protein
MSRSFAGCPRSRRRAACAIASPILVASLALLFAFPAPKAYIEAQVELRGWHSEGDVQAEILGGKVVDWDPTAGSS